MSVPFLTYHQWQDYSLRRAHETNQLIDCPFCEASGCHRCDENCQIPFLDLRDSEQESYFDRAAYKAALLDDVKALCEWTRQDMTTLLVEMGFHPYTVIRGKRLEIDL